MSRSNREKVFEEGRFWLELPEITDRDNESLTLYHLCRQRKIHGKSSDILLDYEIENNSCHFCGEIKIPDNIKTLWVLGRR